MISEKHLPAGDTSMHVLTISAAGVLLFSTSMVAVAETSAGTVLRFDSNPRTMTLRSGETIVIPDRLPIYGVTTGDKVIVTWAQNGAQRVALRVTKRVTSNDD